MTRAAQDSGNNELTDEETRTLRRLQREQDKAVLAHEAAVMAYKAHISLLSDKYELVPGDAINPRTGEIVRGK